ncbi:MAG TPA: hypothetical protein PLN21_14830 [Gemmatales bacterium]|nr:hypothetical protein [Gemmatales bacterium]
MSYGLISVNAMPPPLTTERLKGISQVLMNHGISDAGATQFIRSGLMTHPSDGKKLLDLLNLVVANFPSGPPGSRATFISSEGGKG